MRSRAARVFRGVCASIGVIVLLLLLALWRWPPDLLRVAASYAAKIVCSNVFLAGRDPDDVLVTDVEAPGLAVMRLMRVSVDRDHGLVRAGLLGFIGKGLAVYRPAQGCTVLADGDLSAAVPPAKAPPADTSASPPSAASAPASAPSAGTAALWPEGDAVETRPDLDRLLHQRTAGPGIRAIVVVDHGRIVAERYGFAVDVNTPLLGWSMTKTVIAGLVGTLVHQRKLTLEQSAGWPAGDARGKIRIADLLGMSSGLRFNEGYGTVSDITRMLYLEPDMARFARDQPLEHPVGSFWSYSSGTANILSRIVQDASGSGSTYAREALFDPLGMKSAVIELDERGTMVGSSYMYATAHDWVRYGQFLLQSGVWQGRALLPPGYVDMMATPVAASGGQYGQGLAWKWAKDAVEPGKNPDAAYGIPPDTFWALGHDGQSMAVIRSRQLVVLRMGLTPARYRYVPEPLVKSILDATQ
ncbi:MAG TPA: serine hydrolase [Steroidobacteraceae bacterium]|jgi:CubicO group peptidase (beta-lactamase class C family)|nr:serine hydrolase [Steroidobacteraceae bacterium]